MTKKSAAANAMALAAEPVGPVELSLSESPGAPQIQKLNQVNRLPSVHDDFTHVTGDLRAHSSRIPSIEMFHAGRMAHMGATPPASSPPPPPLPLQLQPSMSSFLPLQPWAASAAPSSLLPGFPAFMPPTLPQQQPATRPGAMQGSSLDPMRATKLFATDRFHGSPDPDSLSSFASSSHSSRE